MEDREKTIEREEDPPEEDPWSDEAVDAFLDDQMMWPNRWFD